jgi:GTP-binding protein
MVDQIGPTLTASTPPKPTPHSAAAAGQDTLGVSADEAMAWLHTARFLTEAPQLQHLPAHDMPEIAFVGRSNAGKSTSINTLTQTRRMAFASKTPGRTQSINLFALGKHGETDAVLADLPGYGYAAVPKEAKLRWQRVMANYLMTRPNLRGVVMLCDPRRGLTELDEILLDVIRPRVELGLDFLVLLTKADKLTRVEANKAMSIARLQTGGGSLKLFSALKRQGVGEVAQLLHTWAHDPKWTGNGGKRAAASAHQDTGNPSTSEQDLGDQSLGDSDLSDADLGHDDVNDIGTQR